MISRHCLEILSEGKHPQDKKMHVNKLGTHYISINFDFEKSRNLDFFLSFIPAALPQPMVANLYKQHLLITIILHYQRDSNVNVKLL